MHDQYRTFKWALVIGLVIISIITLWPPDRKLKGGIDLVGGTSLLYEIDTTGLTADQERDLSTRVMRILRKRVDPKGQMNLEWRPVGNSRLEIRMPLPPKAVIARREAWERELEKIKAVNLHRFEVEAALDRPVEERAEALGSLVRGVEERRDLLGELAEAYEGRRVAAGGDDPATLDEATQKYESIMRDLLHTSLPLQRLMDILALGSGPKRDEELAKLREEYPAYDRVVNGTSVLGSAIAAYDEWSKDKAELEDPADLKRRIQGAGVLEFRILAERNPQNPSETYSNNPQLAQPIEPYVARLHRYGPRPQSGDRYQWFPVDNVLGFLDLVRESEFESRRGDPRYPIVEPYAGRYYVLAHADPEYGLLRGGDKQKWSLKRAVIDQNPLTGRPAVSFTLDPRGGELFRELTRNNKERLLCIVLDNTAMSYAQIKSEIGEQGQITGDFTYERVQNLVLTLEAGSLPARLKETPLAEKTIGPSLGETNRAQGLRASVGGVIAVALFMLVYYRVIAGGMAVIALTLNLLFVLAVMAALQATFTLPGIAGLILTIGMAVDANVLIFERFREERDRGVPFKKALNAGYDKALSTIVDANLTTLITCIILGFVGSEEVKGFAITLGIGVTTSMFTALFVTRMVFNTLIAKGWLKDLKMFRFLHNPSVDWMGLRRVFMPISCLAVVVGAAAFVTFSVTAKERLYDIEFLGGTSVQIDLEPEYAMADEQVRQIISGSGGPEGLSAVQWLEQAAASLERSKVEPAAQAGRYLVSSDDLSPAQIGDLLRSVIEGKVERGGIGTSPEGATFDAKPGMLTVDGLKELLPKAAALARQTGNQLRSARVQSVADIQAGAPTGLSYEIVTTATDRALVQAAITAVLGDKLNIQRPMAYEAIVDSQITQEPYFVVETDDHYLSDVLNVDAPYDIRQFRGGVAIDIRLADDEEPMTAEALSRRLRQVGLLPEFERYQTRESVIYPAGEARTIRGESQPGYKRFAILMVDESIPYNEDEVRWAESVAKPQLAQVMAALESERSLSKVVQFAPQVAGQTKNRAIFAIVLALTAIVIYVGMRFGNKEFGLAAIVAVVHDVCVTLGLIVLSHFLFHAGAGRILGLEDFRIDLAMIAAILTVVGYSLNDTIIVFDRIRENRGKAGAITESLINSSINQTLSRTLITSGTTLLVVLILYLWGGGGVHGFAFAMLFGVGVGTYSSIGIAAPLLNRPALLYGVVYTIAAAGIIGAIMAVAASSAARIILIVMVIAFAGWLFARTARGAAFVPGGRPVGA